MLCVEASSATGKCHCTEQCVVLQGVGMHFEECFKVFHYRRVRSEAAQIGFGPNAGSMEALSTPGAGLDPAFHGTGDWTYTGADWTAPTATPTDSAPGLPGWTEAQQPMVSEALPTSRYGWTQGAYSHGSSLPSAAEGAGVLCVLAQSSLASSFQSILEHHLQRQNTVD